MPQALIIDSRFPDSQLSENDPANPKNIVKSVTMAQDQATADTRYDAPVKRLDGFMDLSSFRTSALIVRSLCTAVAIVALYLLFQPRSNFQRVALGVILIYCLHALVASLQKDTE
jgi:hypothetical protein